MIFLQIKMICLVIRQNKPGGSENTALLAGYNQTYNEINKERAKKGVFL